MGCSVSLLPRGDGVCDGDEVDDAVCIGMGRCRLNCLEDNNNEYTNKYSSLPFDVNIVHPSISPYLGSFFFAAAPPDYQIYSTESGESDVLTCSTVSSCDSSMEVIDALNISTLSGGVDSSYVSKSNNTTFISQQGVEVLAPAEEDILQRKRTGVVEYATNTLPSFRKGHPLHLKITEAYKGYKGSLAQNQVSPLTQSIGAGGGVNDSFTSNEDDFSYDPLFSSGKYIVETGSGQPYGGGLSVNMGAQFSCLRDRWGRVLAATATRAKQQSSNLPSHIIYSPKPFFTNQRHSSNRSVGPPSHRDDCHCRLYPWALLKKDGPTVEDGVSLFMIDEEYSRQHGSNNASVNNSPTANNDNNYIQLSGSFFRKEPSFRSKNIFQDGIHSQTVVSKVEQPTVNVGGAGVYSHSDDSHIRKVIDIPCCHVNRDRFIFDIFDVRIAPGIDPLLIICYLAVHTRMDAEIIIAQSKVKLLKSNQDAIAAANAAANYTSLTSRLT